MNDEDGYSFVYIPLSLSAPLSSGPVVRVMNTFLREQKMQLPSSCSSTLSKSVGLKWRRGDRKQLKARSHRQKRLGIPSVPPLHNHTVIRWWFDALCCNSNFSWHAMLPLGAN